MSEYIVEFRSLAMLSRVVESESNRLREPVVRCRDCKYADETESGSLHCNGYLVEDWDWYNDEPSDGRMVEPDGFCAWGESE